MDSASTAAAFFEDIVPMKADGKSWSEERCLELIKEYRARPILWDKKSPFYYNSKMRPDAWEEIGKAMKMPAVNCKHKMSVLMSSFRREKAKIAANRKLKGIPKSYSRSKDKLYTSSWFGYKEMMSFMENNIKTKKTYTTDEDVFIGGLLEVRSVNCQKNTDKQKIAQRKKKKGGTLETVEQTTSSSDVECVDETKAETLELPFQTPMTSTAQAEPAHLSRRIGMVPTATQILPDQPPFVMQVRQEIKSSSEVEEEINSFARFIAMKMKKFSQSTKNAVQKEICEIIFKADLGFYDQTNDASLNTDFVDITNIKDETVIKDYFSESE